MASSRDAPHARCHRPHGPRRPEAGHLRSVGQLRAVLEGDEPVPAGMGALSEGMGVLRSPRDAPAGARQHRRGVAAPVLRSDFPLLGHARDWRRAVLLARRPALLGALEVGGSTRVERPRRQQPGAHRARVLGCRLGSHLRRLSARAPHGSQLEPLLPLPEHRDVRGPVHPNGGPCRRHLPLLVLRPDGRGAYVLARQRSTARWRHGHRVERRCHQVRCELRRLDGQHRYSQLHELSRRVPVELAQRRAPRVGILRRAAGSRRGPVFDLRARRPASAHHATVDRDRRHARVPSRTREEFRRADVARRPSDLVSRPAEVYRFLRCGRGLRGLPQRSSARRVHVRSARVGFRVRRGWRRPVSLPLATARETLRRSALAPARLPLADR